MNVLRWFVDIWLRFSTWCRTRRDTIERLEARIEHLQRVHRVESEDLRDQIKIKDKQIALMALAHERHRSIIAADIAVNARARA